MNKIYNNVYTYVLKFKNRTYELQVNDKIQYNDAYYQSEKKTRLITESGKLHFFTISSQKICLKYTNLFSLKNICSSLEKILCIRLSQKTDTIL